MSPDKGQKGAAAPSRREGQRRLGLLVFAVLLIGLFVGVAVAQGIGSPDVPDGDVAVVEEAPDSAVTQEDLDAAMRILAAGQGLTKPPEEGDPQFEQFEQAAASDAILSRWVRGEAEDRDIEVFEREVDQSLEQVINQQFGSQKAFDRYLERTGITVDEVRARLELERIGQRIQETILPEETEVTDAEVETYYEENRSQFEQPELRDVREVLTETEEEANEALEQLGANPDAETWRAVAKEFSTDEATKSNGGLRPAVAEGQSDDALDEQIFSAPVDELVGPFETDAGFYVIQVENVEPAKTESLDDAAETIRQILRGAREQQLAATFQEDFTEKWRSRTYCADEFTGVDRCSNADPPVDPCNEELAESTGCGAAVPSLRVIEPGAAGVFGSPAPLGRPQAPVTGDAAAPQQPGLIPTQGGVPQAPPGGGAAPPGGAQPPGG